MHKVLRAVLYAIAGAIGLGLIAMFGGLLLASILGDSGQALGMLVPMVIAPLAIVLGALIGAYKGFTRG